MTSIHTSDIDVVIPVYNGKKFIEAALESVCRQTMCPKRIIIVNDGSTDDTKEIVGETFRQWKDLPSELILLNTPNRGLSAARNTGIRNSLSEYIAFLDADDVWLPQKLELQRRQFDLSLCSNVGVVYCDLDIIDLKGNPLPDHPRTPINPEIKGKVYNRLLNGNYIASSASGALCKRLCFEKAGLFDETLQSSEDWDMWLRIARLFEFDFVARTLVSIRRHAENMSVNTVRMYESILLVLQKQNAETPSDEIIQKALRTKLMINAPTTASFMKVVWNRRDRRFHGLRKSLCQTFAGKVMLTFKFITSRLRRNLGF